MRLRQECVPAPFLVDFLISSLGLMHELLGLT